MMNFEEKAKAVLDLIYSDFGQSGGIDVLTLVEEFHAIRNAAMKEGRKQGLEEAAKIVKEPLDRPTEEEKAQMEQGMTISEIKADRILKLIEL